MGNFFLIFNWASPGLCIKIQQALIAIFIINLIAAFLKILSEIYKTVDFSQQSYLLLKAPY